MRCCLSKHNGCRIEPDDLAGILFGAAGDDLRRFVGAEGVPGGMDAKRVSVEAGMTIGWERFVGEKGLALGIDHFGASAPCDELAKLYGFTAESVAEHTLKYLGR